MPTSPDKKTAFAIMLDDAINRSPLQQNEIAEKIGYKNANIMTMFKRGMTRLPLDKVVALATALDADPAVWLRLWFDAYMPGCIDDLEANIGLKLTTAEKSWIKGLRKAFRNMVPVFELKHLRMPATRP